MLNRHKQKGRRDQRVEQLQSHFGLGDRREVQETPHSFQPMVHFSVVFAVPLQ